MVICPRCDWNQTSGRRRRTSLGYRSFACRACQSVFNERTSTPFNEWTGSKISIARQIGNAVPQRLAEAVALHVTDLLRRRAPRPSI